MRPNTHKPTKAPRRQHPQPDTTPNTASSTPTPTPSHPKLHLPRHTPKKCTPEPPTPPSDQATATSLQETDPATADEYDTSFHRGITAGDTEPRSSDDSRGDTPTAAAPVAAACDITFSGIFGPSTSHSPDTEHVHGLWGWDATSGSSAGAAAAMVGATGGTDRLHVLGDAMALVADAEANAAAEGRGEALSPQHLPGAAEAPAARPGGELRRSLREVYRKLRQNERRVKRVQRKLRMYKAEMQYLKSRRRRIWSLV